MAMLAVHFCVEGHVIPSTEKDGALMSDRTALAVAVAAVILLAILAAGGGSFVPAINAARKALGLPPQDLPPPRDYDVPDSDAPWWRNTPLRDATGGQFGTCGICASRRYSLFGTVTEQAAAMGA